MATKFSSRIETISRPDYIRETLSVTGTVVSGTYPEPGVAGSNIYQPSSGMYQTVYDYPHLSQSANQLFDITWGVRTGGTFASNVVTGTATDSQAKFNIYNQMAALILGYDQTGSVRVFDVSGNFNSVNATSVMDAPVFINLSRLVGKDELAKGSFNLQISTNQYDEPQIFSSTAATANITCVSSTPADYDGKKVIIKSTDGTSKNYLFDDSGSPATGTVVGSDVIVQINALATAAAIAAQLEAAIEGATGHNGKITVTTGASMTLTQASAGNNGNTIIDRTTLVNATLTKTNFSGGGSAYIEITDSGSSDLENGLRILRKKSDLTHVGILDRYRGIAAIQLSSSVVSTILNDGSGLADNYFVSSSTAARQWDFSGSVHSGTIDELATGLRHRIYNMQLSNVSQLNTTMYTITAQAGDFNYSSNPSYIDASGSIRIKQTEQGTLDSNYPAYAYVTGIGLYSSDGELLAVAKLSRPIKKSDSGPLSLSVKLTY